MELLAERQLTSVVICESAGYYADDADDVALRSAECEKDFCVFVSFAQTPAKQGQIG